MASSAQSTSPQDPRAAIWREGDLWVSVAKPLGGFGATKVRVNQEYLMFEKGTLRSDAQQVPLARIVDVDAMQSMIQKSRGVGDIRVHVDRGGRMEYVYLQDLPDHRAGVEKINELSRRARHAEQQRQHTQHVHYDGAPQFQQQPPPPPAAPPVPARPGADEIFGQIERLGELHAKGYISDEDFNGKKAELLARL